MGKPFDFLCPINECKFSKNPVCADKSQIRIHLVRKHDYKQYQRAAYEQRLVPSIMYRSRGFFINLLCDYGIVRGSRWCLNLNRLFQVLVFVIITTDAKAPEDVIVGVIKMEK
mgnify:CR=1 FL=1